MIRSLSLDIWHTLRQTVGQYGGVPLNVNRKFLPHNYFCFSIPLGIAPVGGLMLIMWKTLFSCQKILDQLQFTSVAVAHMMEEPL